MEKLIHPLLMAVVPIAKGVAETFGSNCEVVIHDFQNLDNSIEIGRASCRERV